MMGITCRLRDEGSLFEVVFLGTAAGVPAVDRGLPALLVLHGQRRFLVDCGEGTQRQLFASGLGLRRLDCVLLTHAHLDHLLGIGGLVATWRCSKPAGASLCTAARRRSAPCGACWPRWSGPTDRPDSRSKVSCSPPAPSSKTIILRVRAFPVTHRGTDNFGFAFEEKPTPRMLPERLAALGVPAGPERRRLLAGEEIVLADGRRIAPDEVLAPPQPGTRLVVVGDAADADELLEEVRGADALIIEATFLERDADKAAERSHLTAAQAARLARAANVRALYLTHLSSRYTQAEIEAEARAIFPGAVVARDFDRVVVKAAV